MGMLATSPKLVQAPTSSCAWRAAVGAATWLVGLPVLRPGWAVGLFLLGPLVLLPLGLALGAGLAQRCRNPRLWRAACRLQLPAALVLLVAFALPPGLLAAAGSLPWFAFTLLAAILGAAQLRQRAGRSMPTVAAASGLIYLAVGGTWTVLSRWGARPLGFSDLIVLATAVHFHYAGFVLPVLAGRLVAVLRTRLMKWAAAGVLVGVPLVALGMTLSAFEVRLVEWLAAGLLAVAAALVAVGQCRLAARPGRWHNRLLLAVSGLSLLAGMILAAGYAASNYWGFRWLDVEQMLPFHGAVNALGFALPGLLAWNLAGADEPAAPSAC